MEDPKELYQESPESAKLKDSLPVVPKYHCQHCNNLLSDAETFHEQCFYCGKKPL